MTSYLDWARAKLDTAPATACAFWVDVDQLLSRRHGGGLDDAEQQTILDGGGREWTVVRYLANPLLARHLLSSSGNQVIAWCIGTPGRDYTDLTPLEDHLVRAWHVLDISLNAVAEDLRPGLDLPRDLSAAFRGIRFDVTGYIQAIAEVSSHSVVTGLTAGNVLIRQLCAGAPGIDVSSASRVLLSSALSFARAANENAVKSVRLAVESAAHVDARYGQLLTAIRQADPRDIIAAACAASAFARLQVPNIGQLLAAEGFCPPDVREAFEAAGGRWPDLGVIPDDDCVALSAGFEQALDASAESRLREILAGIPGLDLDRAAAEPVAGMRLAAVVAHLERFIDGPWLASSAPAATAIGRSELEAIDAVAAAIRAGRNARGLEPPVGRLEDIASAFVACSLATASLDVARGRVALQLIEPRLAPETATRLRSRLAEAERDVRSVMALWDASWVGLIRENVSSYLNHDLQGWRRTVAFGEAAAGQESWMLVLDGLRYDLWIAIVAPALERSDWRIQRGDVSFAYLPSLTEVARRTLVGGSPGAVDGTEPKLVQEMAERAGFEASYALRAEHLGSENDVAKGWNVRVFSWPDKFVHSDIADLGTLAGQFDTWVESEFIPWMKAIVSRQARVVVTTDHGFASLDAQDSIDVSAPNDGDRNVPRVLEGALPELGLVLDRGGRAVTIATTHGWFRSPGGHHWRFAHGGCTIQETVVPFAELSVIEEGTADITIEGLPASLEIAEDQDVVLDFRVRVIGGGEMFPSVVVNTNLAKLQQERIELGVDRSFRVTLTGREGLEKLLVAVSTGSDRRQQVVPIRVKLGKIKRTAVDLDI